MAFSGRHLLPSLLSDCVTVRRIWVRYSSAYPWKNLFAAVWSALRC
jgi:hypothetical protein